MGRPAGSKNRNASEFAALNAKYKRKYKTDALETLYMMMDKSKPDDIRIRAAAGIMPYEHTKKVQLKVDEVQKEFNFGFAEDIAADESAHVEH